jgi:hypothetical protein
MSVRMGSLHLTHWSETLEPARLVNSGSSCRKCERMTAQLGGETPFHVTRRQHVINMGTAHTYSPNMLDTVW